MEHKYLIVARSSGFVYLWIEAPQNATREELINLALKRKAVAWEWDDDIEIDHSDFWLVKNNQTKEELK